MVRLQTITEVEAEEEILTLSKEQISPKFVVIIVKSLGIMQKKMLQ